MHPLKAEDIRGNWATLILAWNGDGSLDLARIDGQIDALLAAGVDGIYCFGSAGEFHEVTDAQFESVAERLAAGCESAGMPFQIGVSHMSATTSLARLERVRDLAPGAVQVILPDWFPAADAEIDAFLERMSEAADGIGLVLYNPPHAKRLLHWPELGRLAQRFSSLVGVKLAGGDGDWYAAMNEYRGQMSVFIPGHTLATGMSKGAHGAYSNMACLNPRAAQRWAVQCAAGDPEAMVLEKPIREFIVGHIAPFITEHQYCAAACDRLLAQIGGWAEVGERMGWPYRPIPVEHVARLRPIAQQLIPTFFE